MYGFNEKIYKLTLISLCKLLSKWNKGEKGCFFKCQFFQLMILSFFFFVTDTEAITSQLSNFAGRVKITPCKEALQGAGSLALLLIFRLA